MIDPYPLAAPLLRCIEPERAHRLTLWGLKRGLVPGRPTAAPASLRQSLLGLDFANPIGLAAGADKNAEVPLEMLGLGFGFVEVGTVTPRPQAGNPRPRLFRLSRERALINRLGFNNEGLAAMLGRLRGLGPRPGPIGVNLGANRDAEDPVEDYVAGIEAVAALADFVTVNISSPNTPGLRDLQGAEQLRRLLGRVMAAREASGRRLPLLVKLAPDLDDEALAASAAILLEAPVDGAIMGNTTIGLRERLGGRHGGEAGGLSGRPLFELSTERLGRLYRLIEGKIPLIGVGGVDSGATAYAKIKAGASLVQLYTALVYGGPALVGRIVDELAALLARDGYRTIGEAVGKGV
ncbi:MAG: quinone-dependent dihydroorotate dehydrogenase [Alphaproteobacteria bacterium]|jgi:dihydroorotate dehydrogenase|nr:quinone-dependent dihydroorotate dehydrogenase [Alphaproteobacteria bacterium]